MMRSINKNVKQLNTTTLGIFLLIFYFALLPLKDFIYPSQGIIPIMLTIAIGVIIVKDGGIHVRNSIYSNIEYIWILAALIVLLYNDSLFSELITGGVIQFLILTCFIHFAKFRYNWQESMYKLMYRFLMIHVIATFCFALLPTLYQKYIALVYPQSIGEMLKNYNNGRIAGLCSNYSTNGIYISLAVGISFVALGRNRNIKNILMFIICVAALLMSGKRGPLVFTFLSCVLCYLIASKEKVGKAIKIIASIAIISVLIYVLAQYVPALGNTFGRFADLQNDSSGGRDILFALAIQMWKDNPIFGNGWGSYKYRANASVIGAIYGRESNMYAHNCYLQLLAETGIVGFIIFVGAFLGTLYLTIRQIKKFNRDGDGVGHRYLYVLIISLFMQLFFLMYCMTGNPLYDYVNLFPYMMSCAIPVSIEYLFKKGFITYEKNRYNHI